MRRIGCGRSGVGVRADLHDHRAGRRVMVADRDHGGPGDAVAAERCGVACVKPGWPIVDRTARPGRYISGIGGVKDRYAVSRCGSYRLVSRSRRDHWLEGALGSRNRFEGRRWWRPETHGNPRPMEVRTIASNGAAHDVRVLVASGVTALFANPGTTELALWRRPRRRLRRMAGVVLGRTQAGRRRPRQQRARADR